MLTVLGTCLFNPAHDYVDYDTCTHLTNMDTYERVKEQDFKQSAVILASFTYHAAMRAELLQAAQPK